VQAQIWGAGGKSHPTDSKGNLGIEGC